ncbi:TRIAP1/MDM35 family protein, partial [Tremellales sp. Uapishka_1]
MSRACDRCLLALPIARRGLATTSRLPNAVTTTTRVPRPNVGSKSSLPRLGPALLQTLGTLKAQNRRPTAAAYIAVLKAAAEYAIGRGGVLNGMTAASSEDRFGAEGLGWQIALGAWEDAKRGGVEIGDTAYEHLLRFTIPYPHLLPSLLVELLKTSQIPVSSYDGIARPATYANNIEQLVMIAHDMMERAVPPSATFMRQIIRIACESGCPRLALQLAEKFERESIGLRVNASSWVEILAASADSQFLEGVEEAWAKVIDQKEYTPDEGMILAVLGVAGRWGRPDLASKALEYLTLLSVRPQEHHLAPLLEAFCRAGQVPDAIQVLSYIRSSGITPSMVTVQPIVVILSQDVQVLDQAFYALEDMHKAGTPLDITALNALIEASANLSDLQRARATQTAASDLGLIPDVDTFNLVLSACIAARHRPLGDTILSEMASNSINPNATTYERMILLCATQPTYEDAFYYLEKMKAEGFKPTYAAYEALIRKCAAVQDTRWNLVGEEMESVGHRMDRSLRDFVNKGGRDLYEGDGAARDEARPGMSSKKVERRKAERRTGEGQRRARDQMIGEKRRQSLSPECTSLKHRYDSCFNLWFEGYLQPALDNVAPASTSSTSPHTPAPQSQPTHSSSQSAALHSDLSQVSAPRIKTNWSSALRRETHVDIGVPSSLPSDSNSPIAPSTYVAEVVSEQPIDTRGKTRAQVKAEQYERACGGAWREYQHCLKRAIAENQNLSTLLEQAREEHPLRSQDGLRGTAWDPNSQINTSD